MAIISTETTKVLLPRELDTSMLEDTRKTSTVARLSAREAQRFGEKEYPIFNDLPKAEFVEEGAQKASTGLSLGVVKSTPKKAQFTLRFNEEVQWADEDYQLGVLAECAKAGSVALSRALDLGVYHKINPLTGTVIDGWEAVTDSTKAVELGGADADASVREAVGLVVNDGTGAQVTGLALDPRMSWDLAGLQALSGGQPTGTPRYPNLGFGTDITSFMGINTAQADTVSGTPEAQDTGVRAILGDFNRGIRWAVQRNIPLEVIRWGDPDGQGDLKRQNQIALRMEIVYGWYVNPEKFAVIKAAAGAGE